MSLFKLFIINSNKKCLLNASSNLLVSKLLLITKFHNQSSNDKNIKFINDNQSLNDKNIKLINDNKDNKSTSNPSSGSSIKYQNFIENNKSFINNKLMEFRNELLGAEIKQESHEYTDDDGKKITTKLDYIALKNSKWPTFSSSTLFIRSFYNKYFTERLNSFKFSYFQKDTDLRGCFLLLGTQGIGILFIFYHLYSSEICLW